MHIAIIGCGQLAQMLAQAGHHLGLTFAFVAEAGEDTRCVNHLGEVVVLDKSIQVESMYQAMGSPQVITAEKEMVDTQWMQQFESLANIFPRPNAFYTTQHRVREKNFLRDQGIATAEFEIIASEAQLMSLSDRIGFPIYIKAAESGYDGYQQWHIRSPQDLQQASLLSALSRGGAIIAEKHVDFLRELSIIAVRSCSGEIAVYPMMENIHRNGVLIKTIAPAFESNLSVQDQAMASMKTIMETLDYVGVLTMECFETKEGWVANELAPRVHNSGHWTIEGSSCSQFENHCRAIAGLPLGKTDVRAYAGMINMLGTLLDKAQCQSMDGFFHDYGKSPRHRRKLGHVTFCASTRQGLVERLDATEKLALFDSLC